ncbi:hypothetical protein Pint_14921 [Pistacia integerrima]|uniref:Uncharacterized protein n=1 Tax=Pistacia integerrima TaxID=434235 RepID=A0ACC0ZDI3_9ROSI|nr:hypothetical protein Pint_14921 [Pistacia integerrima]
MTLNLNLPSPFLSNFSTPRFSKFYETFPINSNGNNTAALLSLLFVTRSRPTTMLRSFKTRASLSESENGVVEILDEELLNRVSGAKDANEVLEMVAEKSQISSGVVSVNECCSIINAAIDRGNTDLALSVFYAMRSTFDQGVSENDTFVDRWKWSRPDVSVYTTLVQGLAASLKVSDALRLIEDICRVGVSPGEEVPFGKVVRCPTCFIAVAVAQPQNGIQITQLDNPLLQLLKLQFAWFPTFIFYCCRLYHVPNVATSTSLSLVTLSVLTQKKSGTTPAERSMDIPAWKRGLRFLQIVKQRIPAAVHSIVVQTPSGMARTHRFATETVNLPAQEGERVTVASATPSNVYREVGPFKFSPKAPNFYPGEPMSLTNHKDGRESPLLRAPTKDGSSSLLNPFSLIPLLAVLATGDAASGLIDPSLPKFLSVAAASLAVGATLNTLVLPQLNKVS